MLEIILQFRTWFKGKPPVRTKLQIPGWAGNSKDHSTGSRPQPWHCVPFVEASTYGLSLEYPFETECHVKNINGKIVFEGDFSQEEVEAGIKLPPFSSFAPGHYGFTSSLDLKVPSDYVVRLEPHPRFYTDEIGDVPLAIAGHIQSHWWPQFFFVVFKAPWPGQTHIFRHGEPYAQILILPKKIHYNIQEMSDEEKRQRARQAKSISDYGHDFIAKNPWKDYLGNKFSDKYKVLAQIYAQKGTEGIQQALEQAEKDFQDQQQPKSIKKRFFKIEKL